MRREFADKNPRRGSYSENGGGNTRNAQPTCRCRACFAAASSAEGARWRVPFARDDGKGKPLEAPH